MIGTGEFIYNRDVNGVYYINANLPAAQSAFVGADNRPRWTGTSCATPTVGACVTRLNNVAGNVITNAIVLKNQNDGRSWNIAGSVLKSLDAGLTLKAAYSYGESSNTVDAGSIAAGSFTNNAMSGDPNNPGLSYSSNSPGHRVFVAASYTKQYFGFGGTTVSAFWEARTNSNTSYVFSADMNQRFGVRQRPDLHPARSVGDELLAVHRRHAAPSPPPSRRRRGTPTSRRTAI